MRKLVVAAFVSADGVMQGPGGPDEDPTGGFTQGGWAVNHWDDTMYAAMSRTFGEPFDLLLGRKTYDIFAAHWPHVGEGERDRRGGTASEIDDPIAATLTAARKYVASRTLANPSWPNTVVLEDDVAQAVTRLKALDGPDILTQGSTELLQTLIANDLVDEFRLWTFPVILGRGKRLFGGGASPGALDLVEAVTSSTGVLMATYRRAGDVDVGSFEFDDPTAEELERRRHLSTD